MHIRIALPKTTRCAAKHGRHLQLVCSSVRSPVRNGELAPGHHARSRLLAALHFEVAVVVAEHEAFIVQQKWEDAFLEPQRRVLAAYACT